MGGILWEAQTRRKLISFPFSLVPGCSTRRPVGGRRYRRDPSAGSELAGPAADQPRAENAGVTGEQGKTEHATAPDDQPVCGIPMKGLWHGGRLHGDCGRDRHEAYRPGVCGRLQPLRERR
jgi:hypothetical protein